MFVALEACDMRKGFNGLHALVTEKLGEDPRGGALFVNGAASERKSVNSSTTNRAASCAAAPSAADTCTARIAISPR